MKLDVKALRYLTSEDFRVLTAVNSTNYGIFNFNNICSIAF
jgi:RIO-like serine/threonine protein kinase